MLLPWGDEQLATQRGEIRGRGRGGERRPNYTRYRPTSKEPTVSSPLRTIPSEWPAREQRSSSSYTPELRRPTQTWLCLRYSSSFSRLSFLPFLFLPIFYSTRTLLALFDRGITRGGRTRFVRKHYRYIIRLSRAFVIVDVYSWNSEFYLCLTLWTKCIIVEIFFSLHIYKQYIIFHI